MITGAEDRQQDDNDSDVDDIPMLNAGTTPESLIPLFSSAVSCCGPIR